MGKHRAAAELRRDTEFAAFTAGAAGRLLHSALLLTGDRAEAERLLTATLARTYADWFRMRAEDPYERARGELVRRFASRPWWRRPHGGTLDRLTGRERLIVTMRFFEGVAEEQTAAQLGLPAERVRAICARATATLRSGEYGGGSGSSGSAGSSGPGGTSGSAGSPGSSGAVASAGAGTPGSPGAAASAGAGLSAGSGVRGPGRKAVAGQVAGERTTAEGAARESSGSPVREVAP